MQLESQLPELIRRHLPSVWALEVLLLLRRDPEFAWTIQQLTRELRATEPLVAAALSQFVRSGLAVQDEAGQYRYAPASDLLAQFGELIARQYKERPVSIVTLIAAPEHRIQQLADAFRFGFRSDRR